MGHHHTSDATHRSLFNNLYIAVGLDCYLKQTHIHSADDTETATPGYGRERGDWSQRRVQHGAQYHFQVSHPNTDLTYDNNCIRSAHSAVRNSSRLCIRFLNERRDARACTEVIVRLRFRCDGGSVGMVAADSGHGDGTNQGAMFYVVVEELIPEASEGNHSNLSTIGFAIGFVLMMVLDVVMG